ncbi:ATP-binding cassette transporter snq2 [Paramarasmius palmivorus]|uniref:ATP-binding cassette transporter snq2 n=1 Tax=Paramarasmius palmivorus TaxID=297713 RepID=A0AAW0BGY1_9AGAR
MAGVERSSHIQEISDRPDTSSSASTLRGVAPGEKVNLPELLSKVIRKKDEADLKSREIGVMFENLRVVGLGSSSSYQPTFGSLFNPVDMLEKIQNLRHPTTKDILSDFEGVVKPGEMLLVLGRPGAGCSTFLKTLANQREEYHAIEGEVHYHSFTPNEIRKRFRGDVLFCPEDDLHFPTLTVEQTIKFAARMRAPRDRLGSSREEYVNDMTNTLLSLFGLNEVRHTLVGDAAVRGVSGGQKKRVSICEVLATRPRLVSWDNSTRGLDSSTALEYVQTLRTFTDLARMTSIVSLYQPGESLYKLFDKVCVIYEGRLAYFGPASEARSYFINMGYEPANRQTTADFLVAVTDPNGRIPRADLQLSSIPRTAEEFAAYFRISDIAEDNRAAIKAYRRDFVDHPELREAYKASAKAEHGRHTRKSSPYLVSIAMQAKAVMLRRLQMLKGSWLSTALNSFSYVFNGLIVGSVFFEAPENTSAYFSRGGVLFFTQLFAALVTMAEIPALFAQRPIVLRHMKYALHHPFIDQAALFLVDLPIIFLQLGIFVVLIYELVQLQQSASQFFVAFLFVFSVTITMKGWFRALAAAFGDEAPAQSVAGISILAFSIYAGYMIPKPTMIGGLRWISYLNPFRWGFETLLTNEFRTVNGYCSGLIPSGPGYENITIANQVCPTVGALPGSDYVNGNRFTELSFEYNWDNAWRNFGIIIGYGVAFIGACLFFTEWNTKTPANSGATLFKRSTKTALMKGGNDEEKAGGSDDHVIVEKESPKKDVTKKAPVEENIQEVVTTSAHDIFSWQGISYSVPVGGGEMRRLLNNVTGFVAPGKLTALMGESGAGKTTLLNVLAERVDVGVVTGDRFVNGHPLPSDFQAQTGYCQQMDTHVPAATVREALLFSAKLRQPHSVPLAEKEAYVDKCLNICGLEAFRDAAVGSLNIENRKRTTIAVELAAKPKLLLFLDEPTSGLDSQSAWAIVAFLRDLANNGQAILCTIHQPSAELFQVFDRLLLLRKGGETVYFGDLGHNATTLLGYFEKNGSRHCEPEENPAEFMLDVIGAGATATSEQDWHEIWKNSSEKTQLDIEVDRIHSEGRTRPPVQASFEHEFATPWYFQTWELLKRNCQSHYRDPIYLVAKFVLCIFAGIFIGFSFFKAKDSQQGTQNKLFSIFMATILSVPLANQLMVVFINMRSIYEIRERPSRMYSWTALVTSQFLTDLPWNIAGSTLFYLCWYWTVGYDSDRAGYTYLMIGVLFPMYYTSIGQATAAMCPNAEIAAILFSLLFSFVITFNGVMQPYSQLGWWKWMYRLTPYTYLIEGLLGQAIGNQNMFCSDVELATIIPPSGQTCGQYMSTWLSNNGGYLVNPNDTSSCQFCSTDTTNAYLAQRFNIFYSHRWRNVGVFAGFIVFNIAAIYFFTFWFRIRTWSVIDVFRRKKKTTSS